MADWKNRITGHGEIRAADFLANPLNWRIHPAGQQSALKGALDEIGWIDEVTVNQRTNFIVDGHLRVILALREGDDVSVPVKFVDLSPEEENIALTTKDPITALAVADKEKLDALLRDTKPAEAALQQMLSELAAREGLYTGDGDKGELDGIDIGIEQAHLSLSERFLVPPFSVLDARQGYWQERKRAWLALGIQSELGRGENAIGESDGVNVRYADGSGPYGRHANATPGGSPRPAASLGPDGKT